MLKDICVLALIWSFSVLFFLGIARKLLLLTMTITREEKEERKEE